MQQRGDQLHLHPLAQRELAHRLLGQLLHAQETGQLIQRVPELRRRDRVDLAQELEAIGGRQVPPELILLPHHQRELAAERIGPLPGDEAQHPCLAGRRIDQPREHLQRRRLPRPVGAQERDHLPRLDREADRLDGADLPVLAVVEPAQGALHAFLLLDDAIGLGQAHHLDHAHDSTREDARASQS